MDFKNYFCPVCNNKFTDDDDVVVCPECGTPHHRDCYFSNGGCFNADKHNSDENISEAYKQDVAEEIEAIPVDPVEFQDKKEEERNEFFKNVSFNPSSTPLIGGKHGYLFEIAIGKNQRYYIPRFMLMDKFQKASTGISLPLSVPLRGAFTVKCTSFQHLFLRYTCLFSAQRATLL